MVHGFIKMEIKKLHLAYFIKTKSELVETTYQGENDDKRTYDEKAYDESRIEFIQDEEDNEFVSEVKRSCYVGSLLWD